MKKILFIISLILLSTSAFAQDDVLDSNVDNAKPCKEDRKTLCKDVKMGEGRIIKCFKENESKLSPACKAHLEAKKKEAKENHSKCKDDRRKFCKGVKPGEGRIIECLKGHLSELSSSCKEVFANK